MPIYLYECQKCKREFEYSQKMSDPPKTRCQACKGKLVKIIAPTAFVLKGGGWYKDLYSSSKGEAKSESKTEAGAEAKTESKPEGKPESKSDKKDRLERAAKKDKSK